MKVHWQGYDDDTWEPLENMIRDVEEIAEEFFMKRYGVTIKQLKYEKYRG